MAKRSIRLRWIIPFVVLALVAAVLLGAIPLNLSFAKNDIAEWAHQATGWQLEIEGKLNVRLGFQPKVSISSISLTPDDPEIPPIAIESLEAASHWLSLLRGEVDIRHLDASGISAKFCPGPWCGNRWLPEEIHLSGEAPLNERLTLEVQTTIAGAEWAMVVKGDDIESLLADPEQYAFELALQTGQTSAQARGFLAQPLSTPAFEGDVKLETPNLDGFLDLFDLPASGLAAVGMESKAEVNAARLLLKNATGSVNEQAFRFTANITGIGDRLDIDLDAQLPALDLEYFDTTENGAAGAGEDFSPWFEVLSEFDGRLQLSLDKLVNPAARLTDLELLARLEHGVIRLDHANIAVNEIPWTAAGILDTNPDCADLDLRLSIPRFDIAQLNSHIDSSFDLGGMAEQLDLQGSACGSTLDAMLGSMEVEVEVGKTSLILDREQPPLSLESIRGSLSAAGSGDLSMAAIVGGAELDLLLNFGAILDLVDGLPWPMNMQLNAESMDLQVEGHAQIKSENPSLAFALAMEAERFGALSWLGADPGIALPFKANTQVSYQSGNLQLEGIQARLGRSDVRGNIRWPVSATNEPMQIELSSSLVDLAELENAFSGNRETRSTEKSTPQNEDPVQLFKHLPVEAIELDLSAAEISGLSAKTEAVKLDATLREKQIVGGQLSLQIGETRAQGTLDADFRQTSARIAASFELDKLDAGQLLESLDLAQGLDLRAAGASLDLRTEGETLQELTAMQETDLRINDLEWRFPLGPENTPNLVILDLLEMKAVPGSNTNWQTHGSVNGLAMHARVESPSITALFNRELKLPLKVLLSAGQEVTSIDLNIDRSRPGQISADLALTGDWVDSPVTDLSALTSFTGDYFLTVNARWNDQALHMPKVSLSVGDSLVEGELNLTQQGQKILLETDLHSPFLETDDFIRFATDLRDSRKILMEEESPETQTDVADAGLMTLITRQAKAMESGLDYALEISIDELRSAGELLGTASLNSSLENNHLLFDIDFDLDQRNVKVDFERSTGNQQSEYGLDIRVEKLSYGNLLKLFNADSHAQGEVHLDASLRSVSSDPEAIIQNTRGYVEMLLVPQEIGAAFLDLWATNLVFAMLQDNEKSTKSLNCLAAQFDVESGVMSTREVLLDSTDVIVRARGEIDLAGRELNLLMTPQAKTERFFSVKTPLQVTGTFDDFSVEVAPGGFMTTMLRWYYQLIYVPWKWLTGERFEAHGLSTCIDAMGWDDGDLTQWNSSPGSGAN